MEFWFIFYHFVQAKDDIDTDAFPAIFRTGDLELPEDSSKESMSGELMVLLF